MNTSNYYIQSRKPGTPRIEWGEFVYSLTEINKSGQCYKDIVIARHDAITVSVSWAVNSGEVTQSKVLLDDVVVWQGTNETQANFDVSKGGRYAMTVEVSNEHGSSTSNAQEVLVCDTDGSHLAPLATELRENNKPYKNTTNKVVGTYFVEWGIYAREFTVDDIPAQNLTHILYGFIPMVGGDGLNDSLKTIPDSFENLQTSTAGQKDFELSIHDPWAAIDKPQPGVMDWSEPYRGNFGQLMALKQAYPHLKILPSIGGWTLSDLSLIHI